MGIAGRSWTCLLALWMCAAGAFAAAPARLQLDPRSTFAEPIVAVPEPAARWLAEAEASGRPVVEVALAQLDGLRPRRARLPAMEGLAQALATQVRFEEAIATLQLIQRRWPEDRGAPGRQYRIAQLSANLPSPDPTAVEAALAVLVDTYGPDSAWAHANRRDAEALAAAQGHIQEALPALAIQEHLRAQAGDDREAYDRAVALYQRYLEQFPTAPDAEEMRSNLADVYYMTERYTEAEALYAALIHAEDPALREFAMWRLMQTRRQMLIDAYGAVETRPPDAAIERRVALPSGELRPVYAVSPAQAAFIEACDALGAVTFSTDPELVRALEHSRAALAYLAAQLLHNLGRFDEARPRLQRIIDAWPRSDEAAFSAALLVDSYAADEDLAMVRNRIIICGPGPHAEPYARLRGVPELSAALAARDEGAYAAAGALFLRYTQEYPDSEHVPDALIAAASQYELIGALDETRKLHEAFVERYPADERAPGLMFKLGNHASDAMDLVTAVHRYEQAATLHPLWADAPTATYNAAFLRLGLDDPAGAAQGFERYARVYPSQPDAEQVSWLAADAWERVGPAEASAFYRRYLRQWPSKNPEHVLRAHTRLAELAEARGDARGASRGWEALAAAGARLEAAGALSETGRAMAAVAALRALEREARAVPADSRGGIPPALMALDRRAEAVRGSLTDPEVRAATLVIVGEAAARGCKPARELLPRCARAEAAWREALAIRAAARQWTGWHDRAEAGLEALDPERYARAHAELQASVDSDVFPVAGAMGLREGVR